MPTASLVLAAAAPNDPAFRWVLIVVAIATILYTVVRPSFKKKDPLNKKASSTSLARQRNVERQMESLLVELSEMSRQITSQLDTRSQKLEALIQEADDKIAELKRLSSSPRPAIESRPAESYERQSLLAPMESPTNVDPRHSEIYHLADQGQTAMDIARQLGRPRGEIELILALRARV